MADGIPNPNVVLKIGFLNKNVEQNLAEYKVELRCAPLLVSLADFCINNMSILVRCVSLDTVNLTSLEF